MYLNLRFKMVHESFPFSEGADFVNDFFLFGGCRLRPRLDSFTRCEHVEAHGVMAEPGTPTGREQLQAR
jgi:hypothetical protein